MNRRKPQKKDPPQAAIHIGPTQGAVREARAAIGDILKAPNCDREVKIAALGTLDRLCSCNNNSVSHNIIGTGT